MFGDLKYRYHWVLSTIRYQGTDEPFALLQARIIAPAEQKSGRAHSAQIIPLQATTL